MIPKGLSREGRKKWIQQLLDEDKDSDQEEIERIKTEWTKDARAVGLTLASLIDRVLGKRTPTGIGRIKDAPCKICGFKTEPLHDGRRHKSQGIYKSDRRPLTNAELTKFGLKKAANDN